MTPISVSQNGQTTRSAWGAPVLEIDMAATLYDLTTSFNPLHKDALIDYQVRSINASQICMSVVMPKGMLIAFSTLLESMGGFFRVVSHRAKASEASRKVHDLSAIEARDKHISSFTTDTLRIFDGFVRAGNDKKTAVRLTNSALKEQQSPYATLYIVEKVLRSAGRLRKNKQPP